MIYAVSIWNFVAFTNRFRIGFHFLSLVYCFVFQNFREFRRKFVWKLCEYGSSVGVRIPIKKTHIRLNGFWCARFSKKITINKCHLRETILRRKEEEKCVKRFDSFYTITKRLEVDERKTNVLQRTVLSESETSENRRIVLGFVNRF